MNAILLLPAPEYRDRLLAEGPCGSRPPTVHQLGGECDPPMWADGPSDGLRWPIVAGPALVLAWDGVAVPEGCDRLARVLSTAHVGKPAPFTIRSCSVLNDYALTMDDAAWGRPYTIGQLVRGAVEAGLGTVIALPETR